MAKNNIMDIEKQNRLYYIQFNQPTNFNLFPIELFHLTILQLNGYIFQQSYFINFRRIFLCRSKQIGSTVPLISQANGKTKRALFKHWMFLQLCSKKETKSKIILAQRSLSSWCLDRKLRQIINSENELTRQSRNHNCRRFILYEFVCI